MAARKLQQEIDREFKRTDEGIELFNSIHDKLLGSQNPSQKDKQEDLLKKEIKKLQRSRDKIKSWAASSEIKDKKPLLEKRRAIETCMEKFKAVEKEMKTKQYSKEGLSAAAKLDPKEKEKMEVGDFLTDMVDKLGQQIEALEAESEVLQAGMKKKKSDGGKADRVGELEKAMERHKWNISKLEILARALENGGVEVEQVKDIEESIRYYVEQNQEVDFVEDEALYDDLNLEEEEDYYGLNKDDDRDGSQDALSTQDEPPENDGPHRTSSNSAKAKSTSVSEGSGPARRSSVQMKSPLPALSTLHSSLPSGSLSGKPVESMKPAPLPTIPTGQTLKYASAAAAAAASDKNGIGIAPLPPPPGASKTSETSSPAVSAAQPVSVAPSPSQAPPPQPAKAVEPAKQPSPAPAIAKEVPKAPEPAVSQPSRTSSIKPSPQIAQAQPAAVPESSSTSSSTRAPEGSTAASSLANGEAPQQQLPAPSEEEEESIYHLPSSLADLLDSFEETAARSTTSNPFTDAVPLLNTSRLTAPTPLDAEKPAHYQPTTRYPYTLPSYPQEPLDIFDDPRLYGRIDTDSLFYAFYYQQGTYKQFLAAKALKSQSWRFHKQYQTWFQRHEEPKNITEEFEQGTYRFFDYESTW